MFSSSLSRLDSLSFISVLNRLYYDSVTSPWIAACNFDILSLIWLLALGLTFSFMSIIFRLFLRPFGSFYDCGLVWRLSISIFTSFIWFSKFSLLFCSLSSNFFWFFISSSIWIWALFYFLLLSPFDYFSSSIESFIEFISMCKLLIYRYSSSWIAWRAFMACASFPSSWEPALLIATGTS